VVIIPSRIGKERAFAAAAVCVALAFQLAHATWSLADEPHRGAPPATQNGTTGQKPHAAPGDAPRHVPPGDPATSEDDDNETERPEPSWELPSPGCPYQGGPLDLIV
jgi:hypothetical protein